MIAGRKLQAFVKESERDRAAKLAAAAGEELADDDDEEELAAPKPAKKADDAVVLTKALEQIEEEPDAALVTLVTDHLDTAEDEEETPEWVEDSALWTRAHKIAKKRFEEFDQPWVVVAHVYAALGGEVLT